jgi:hypothetical protein
VAKKSGTGKPTSRSGPRAPKGTSPLQVIIPDKTIEEAKVKAIREKTNVSRVTAELLDGWLAGLYRLKKPADQ